MLLKKDKHIVFFGKDPGSVNVLSPVFLEMMKEYNCSAFSCGHGSEQFKKFGIKSRAIPPEGKLGAYLSSVFKKNDFDLVVTGTGIEDFERLVWSFAKKKDVCSVAFIDSWVNLVERFRDSVGQLILPDYIVCIDDFCKNTLMQAGVPAQRIMVLGNPYFQFLLSQNATCSPDTSFVRSTHPILFASQPISAYFPLSSEKGIGYDEFSVLNDVVQVLHRVQSNFEETFELFVKFHPKDDQESLSLFVDSMNSKNLVNVSVFSDKLCLYDYLKVFDVVIGMDSMLLVESFLFHVPVINYEPSKQNKGLFVLERLGHVHCMTSKDMLYNEIVRILFKERFEFSDLGVKNAIDSICDFLGGLL